MRRLLAGAATALALCCILLVAAFALVRLAVPRGHLLPDLGGDARSLSVDGRAYPPDVRAVDLPIGRHRVVVEREWHRAYRADIDLPLDFWPIGGGTALPAAAAALDPGEIARRSLERVAWADGPLPLPWHRLDSATAAAQAERLLAAAVDEGAWSPGRLRDWREQLALLRSPRAFPAAEPVDTVGAGPALRIRVVDNGAWAEFAAAEPAWGVGMAHWLGAQGLARPSYLADYALGSTTDPAWHARPVRGVSHPAALAFARWYAARHPGWRLPDARECRGLSAATWTGDAWPPALAAWQAAHPAAWRFDAPFRLAWRRGVGGAWAARPLPAAACPSDLGLALVRIGET